MAEHFCTCTELDCPMHPGNHDNGCDPCIKKNLKLGEMPTCFFQTVNEDLSGVREYMIDGFVDFYMQNKAANKKAGE